MTCSVSAVDLLKVLPGTHVYSSANALMACSHKHAAARMTTEGTPHVA